MSLQTPTTSEIADNIVAQIDSAISQSVPMLPKSFTRVLAKALAGVFVLLWKYAGVSFLNMFVSTASAVPTTVNGRTITPLIELGRQIGVGDPNPATQAVIELAVTVAIAGTEATVPAGAQLVHQPTGLVFLTTDALTVTATTGTVNVNAIASGGPNNTDGSGVVGNLAEDEELSWVNPHPRLATIAVVLSPLITEAVDAEDVDTAYRARVLRRWQRKPQGGAYADYQLWAEEVEGVANAYPYTGIPGEVDVYVEVVPSLDPDGIPDQDILDAVEASIELDEDGLATRRPATAAVNVLPIGRTAFDVTCANLLPDTPETRDAVEAAVDEHLRSLEPFIVGLSTFPRRDRVSQLAVSGVVHEIASAEGATVATVTLEEGGLGINGRSLANGEKAKLGVMTWL